MLYVLKVFGFLPGCQNFSLGVRPACVNVGILLAVSEGKFLPLINLF